MTLVYIQSLAKVCVALRSEAHSSAAYTCALEVSLMVTVLLLNPFGVQHTVSRTKDTRIELQS